MSQAFSASGEDELAVSVGLESREAQRVILRKMRIMANWTIPEVMDHGRRTAELALDFARFLNWNEGDSELVYYAAYVHDIGKMAVERNILMKTSYLEEQEVGLVRQHTQAGHQVFSSLEGDLYQACASVALNHHERWDGKGYPSGKRGEEIPMLARLVSVVDVFDCIRFDRPYRKAMSEEQALEELKSHAGSQFDAEFVDKFLIFKGQSGSGAA